MRLLGKTAVITGAASGIGRAIALLYASQGAQVVIADVRNNPREGGKTTEQTIRDAGYEVLSLSCDVSKWEDVHRLVDAAVEEYGRLDILINNAAVSPNGNLVETTDEMWDMVMGINLKGVFYCCKKAVKQMLLQAPVNEVRGRIINISSQHGMISAPGSFAYGVSKSGVVYMTRQIASDYARHQIICNAVAPGKIITGKSGHAASVEMIEYSKLRTPMPRLGRPEDVAGAALFLGSDEASYITGVNLLVDGGWMAS